MISPLPVRLLTTHVRTTDNKMKRWLLTWVCCLSAVAFYAQSGDDPVLMTVNGLPVLRSEFVSSYHRNAAIIDAEPLSVNDFLDRFVDYKLKVAAAVDAGYKVLPAKPAPAAKPSATLNTAEAEECYRLACAATGNSDMINPMQILLRVDTRASATEVARVKQRIDSIALAIKGGAVFSDLARRLSDDSSASNGGDMGWIAPNQLLAEVERVAYGLQAGEVSEPFLSPAGWHIVAMIDRQPATSEVVHQWFLTPRTTNPSTCTMPVVDELLAREYHEGMLVAQVTQMTLGNLPEPDEKTLMRYFKKNKKRYGKKLKKRDFPTVRELVLADYQQQREREWLEGLRRQYKVKVNKSILKTIE